MPPRIFRVCERLLGWHMLVIARAPEAAGIRR
jgi:hypothetical protein